MRPQQSRKEFLKIAGKVTCSVMLAGAVSSMVQSCSSVKVYQAQAQAGKIKVPLSVFNESNVSIVRVEGLRYDMLVSKKDDVSFSAVLMQCSHQDWNLTASGNGLVCGLHGSTFDADGNVKNGPATEPLKQFKVEKQDNYLIIS